MEQRCKMSEKQRYWTEFESTRHQFFKVMVGDNLKDELRIPREFKDNFKEKLPETIGLRGPSGHVWNVKLTKGTDDWLFQNGWEDFVRDHGLGEFDFLVFRYDENGTFKVTIFGKSGCEREDAYFIKKCKKDMQREVKGKNIAGASRLNESQTASNAEILSSTSNRKKGRRTEYVGQVPSPGMSGSSEEGDSVECEDANSDVARQGHRKEKQGTDKAQTGAAGSQEMRLPETKYTSYLMSKRREVTQEEIQRAYNLATKHKSTEPSITLVMKPTNVYKYFFVNIPKEWARKHMSSTHNSKVHLKVPPCEKIWSIQWKCNTYKTGFSKGWYKFVMENNLEEHDACVFQLIKGGKGIKKTPVFDVIIFRVVDEIIPMTHLIRKPQLK